MTKPADLSKSPIPESPNVMKALCVIWRVPYNGLEIQEDSTGKQRAKANGKAMKLMREQPDNAADPLRIGDMLPDYGKGFRLPSAS